jgi:dipeptidase E
MSSHDARTGGGSPERQIIAMGGFSSDPRDRLLLRYILAQARSPRPKVCFLTTASGDADSYIAKSYEHFAPLGCELSYRKLFGRVGELEKHIPEQDVIFVTGGNTKSMLALWREYGLDVLLRRAWEGGTILSGFSAGAVCWFAEGLSDAFADRLVSVKGLGLLAGSACPHYNSELDRRPTFQGMIARGEIGPGIAIDDGATVHFHGANPSAVVAARPESNAYRIASTGESILEVERVTLG